MKKLLIVLCMALPAVLRAQVTKVSIQAAGLTCSMCSRAIYKALKEIDFVDSVQANIKNSTFEVMIRQGAAADFDRLRKGVEDAGFSVSGFYAVMQFSNTKAAPDSHVMVGTNTLHFLNAKEQVLNGSKTIRIVDKGFVSAKEFKKNRVLTKMKCYENGVAGDCCTRDGVTAGTRIFHVII